MIYASTMTYRFWKFHASAMTLFLLLIWWVGREFIGTVNSIWQLSLNIQWWFQVKQGLCFRWRFMDQQWHSIFDNSICQPSLNFCYRFDASVMNSVTLSIPYVSCHSIFIDAFKFYMDFVFADDLWIYNEIEFLTIPCISIDSIFAIDLMRRSWIHWSCRLHTSAVTQYSLTISRSIVTLFTPAFYGSGGTPFLTVPCISHDSIFVIDLIHRSGICCDIAVAQINYPSFKHNTQDSIEQARGLSHEEVSSQIFLLYVM